MAGGFFLRYLILYISGWYFLPGPSKFLVHFVTSALPRLVRGMHNHVSPGLKDTHRQPENSPWQAVSLPSVQDTGFCFPVIEPFGHGTCFLILRPMKRQISALKFRCLNGLKLDHIYSSCNFKFFQKQGPRKPQVQQAPGLGPLLSCTHR